MTTYVMRAGRLVKKQRAAPLRGVAVISDSMAMLKHPGTGAMIDSKSRFREHTRASGCVEVGTETMREQPRYEPSVLEIVHDVKRSIAELRSR